MTHNTDEPIIEVQGLWKRYGLPPFLPWKKQKVADHEWALRDISFSVPHGGSLGILGRNGAGKSTLLKLLAGVTPPDRGSIAVRGKIFPMIELTAGMSMELSGVENIRILGTIMGLNNNEIEKIIPEVEDFSELGDWLNKPVWQYSSGMMARLAFGIAVHVKADILLVDEVLSVGDLLFQRKCQNRIEELLSVGNVTLLFVSHSPYQVELMCEEAIILSHGICICSGDSLYVMNKYLSQMNEEQNIKGVYDLRLNANERDGSGDIRITKVNIVNNNSEKKTIITGEELVIRIDYVINKSITGTNISLRILERGARIIFSNMLYVSMDDKYVGNEYSLQCTFPKFPLYGEFFSIEVKIADTILIDHVRQALIFSSKLNELNVVDAGQNGFIVLDYYWS